MHSCLFYDQINKFSLQYVTSLYWKTCKVGVKGYILLGMQWHCEILGQQIAAEPCDNSL